MIYKPYGASVAPTEFDDAKMRRGVAKQQIMHQIERHGPAFKAECVGLKKRAYYINQQVKQLNTDLRPMLDAFLAELAETQALMTTLSAKLGAKPPGQEIEAVGRVYALLPSEVKGLIPGTVRKTWGDAIEALGAYRSPQSDMISAQSAIAQYAQNLRLLRKALTKKPMDYAGLRDACDGSYKGLVESVCRYRNLSYRRMLRPRGGGFRGWRAACDRYKLSSSSLGTKYIDHPPADASNWFPFPSGYGREGYAVKLSEWACVPGHHCGSGADFYGVRGADMLLDATRAVVLVPTAAEGGSDVLQLHYRMQAEIRQYAQRAKDTTDQMMAGYNLIGDNKAVRAAAITILTAVTDAVAAGVSLSTMNPILAGIGLTASGISKWAAGSAWDGMMDKLKANVKAKAKARTKYVPKVEDAWDDSLITWMRYEGDRSAAVDGPLAKMRRGITSFKRMIPTKAECKEIYPTRTIEGWAAIGANLGCSAQQPTYAPRPTPGRHRIYRPGEEEDGSGHGPTGGGSRVAGPERESSFGGIGSPLTMPIVDTRPKETGKTGGFVIRFWHVLAIAGGLPALTGEGARPPLGLPGLLHGRALLRPGALQAHPRGSLPQRLQPHRGPRGGPHRFRDRADHPRDDGPGGGLGAHRARTHRHHGLRGPQHEPR